MAQQTDYTFGAFTDACLAFLGAIVRREMRRGLFIDIDKETEMRMARIVARGEYGVTL